MSELMREALDGQGKGRNNAAPNITAKRIGIHRQTVVLRPHQWASGRQIFEARGCMSTH